MENLPAIKNLGAILRNLDSYISEGTVILKMDKTGEWVFGADQTEVQEGSTWAINPLSFVHGFIAWGDGEVLAEKMTGMANPLPELDAAPEKAKKGWEQQIGFSLTCLTGDDKDLNVRFCATSVGGKRAVATIGKAIADQADKDPAHPVPVVYLESDHYQHKQYGKIYTPIFQVLKWMGMEAEPAPVAVPIAVAAPDVAAKVAETVGVTLAAEPLVKRRRRPAVAAV